MSAKLQEVDADLAAGEREGVEGVEVNVGCDRSYNSVVAIG
jgi:hypothetical protein